MPIATMEELAAVPVGTAVYYGDKKYTRSEDGWFDTEEIPGTSVIRDRFFSGPVRAGKVVPEGEQAVQPGATAIGRAFWYYVKDAPNKRGYLQCIRIVNPSGERGGYGKAGTVENWDREVRPDWIRERLAPLPPEAEGFLRKALVERVADTEKMFNDERTRYNELLVRKQQVERDAATNARMIQDLRTVMTEVMA